MHDSNWFGRTFNFDFGMERYPLLYRQLSEAPALFKQTVAHLPEGLLRYQPGGKWSISEQVGHLLVLEPIWQERFKNIRRGDAQMCPADLDNRATTEGGFNKMPIQTILERFATARATTLKLLDRFGGADFEHKSTHPRLRLPMRVIDLMLFVSEHDGHHLNSVRAIMNAGAK